tara:strand:+ start:125 stop:649 length:525 start_codon:yes stop_codon:yes gene_type:complete
MTVSSICDYVTLFLEDGNYESTGVATWYIPSSSYYFQNRGTLARMSVVDAGYSKGDIATTILIATSDAYNGTVAQVNTSDVLRNDLAIIGTLQKAVTADADEDIQLFFKTEAINVITPARPSSIKLSFLKDNKSQADIDSSGFVVIKFEYLSPEEEQKINNVVDYVEAFPTKGF